MEISVDAYSTILSKIATVQTDVRHLLEAFEKHSQEKSKLGERVGAIEEAIPDELDKRLRQLEIRQGQIAILGAVLIFAWPTLYSEIKQRLDSQPVHPTIQRNP
jgi:hypothetical protein